MSLATLLLFAQLLALISLVVSFDSPCLEIPVNELARLPFDRDTSKYWECLNGVSTLKYCQQNHHFNEISRTCQPLNFPVYESSQICDPDTVDFLPHPTDCTKYIWCYYGTPYIINCEDGLWFSPEEKRCVDPVSSRCTATSEPPWTTPDNSLCADVPDDQIVLKKCTCGCMYYWECRGKIQTLKECEFKLDFVEEKQLCAGLIDCRDQTKTPFPWTTTFPTTIVSRPENCLDYNDPRCHGLDDVYLPHPDCTKFTHCEIGWGLVWNCPEGLYFNAIELKCGMLSESSCANFSTLSVPSTTVTTNTPPNTPDPRCNPDGTLDLISYPTDCTKYIECYDGFSYLMSCPQGLWFNEAKKICVEPEESNCIASTSTAVTSSLEDQRCKEKDGSFLPHYYDCQKFFECYEGRSHERTCPSGLHFDPENERCISPNLSTCRAI